MKNRYQKTQFISSAAQLSQLPEDSGIEVAFAGRSNAGKSSALNKITQQKNLARTSKTPGRTQLINCFSLTEGRRLIDLPGYGYAKVSKAMRDKWQRLLEAYFIKRQSLRGAIIIMDIRHPLTELDQQMITWTLDQQIPIHILLNKADKLKRGPGMNTLHKVQNVLKSLGDRVTVQRFSALTGDGLEQVYAKLDDWYNLGD